MCLLQPRIMRHALVALPNCLLAAVTDPNFRFPSFLSIHFKKSVFDGTSTFLVMRFLVLVFRLAMVLHLFM